MWSLGDEALDEAHCLWALCPHPCCWETEHRIAKGFFRRAARKPTKHNFSVQESLPSLTVVNVSEWAGTRRHSEGKQLYKRGSSSSSESEASLHSILCRPALPQKESMRADPAISSAEANGAKGKGVKLHTACISPLITPESSWGSDSLVLWVPNPDYVPRCASQKRSKSPQYAVKELICLPACPVQKVNEKPKSVKKKVRFHLACSPLSCHSKREAGSFFPGQPEPASNSSPSGEGQRYNIKGASTEHPSEAKQIGLDPEPEDPRESSTFLPKNRPVFLHTVQEKGVKRVSKDVPTSLYKLDNKTGGESVDWDSLRRQVYLWKKHNQGCRDAVCPPGGARVSQDDSGLSSVSKIKPHHHFQSPLSVVPATWHCMKGIWRYQQCSLPLLSHSKNLLGTASEADTISSVYSSSAIENNSSLHRMPMLKADEKSVREEGLKDTITPFNSLLYCQDSKQEHQGSECERSVVQLGHSLPEESYHSANGSPSIISGTVEPWREGNCTDKDPGPKHNQLSTPPPSLDSLL